MPHPPVILKPHEPVAERVLLPGDPGRALRLATQLIDGPRMLNHHRGLWGYSGAAADGGPLTIQSTGLGGPSAAAVVAELVALGARRLIRVGTAAGLAATALGTLVVADAALAFDGASRALGAGERAEAHSQLADALAMASGVALGADERARGRAAYERPTEGGLVASIGAAAVDAPSAGGRPRAAPAVRGLVASADIHDPVLAAAWADAGALACDLTTAAVLAAAARHGAQAAVILAITRARGERIADDALEPLEAALGAAALAALTARTAH